MKIYILSGGKSRRMGSDKALEKINGKPLMMFLIDGIKNINSEKKIIGYHKNYKDFNLDILQDVIEEKGPLGGILTALTDAKEDVLIISVDTPFYSEKHVLELLNNSKKGCITMAISEEKIHPLFAIYPYSLLENIQKSIQKNQLKLMQFLQDYELNLVKFNFTELEKLNINTKEDLQTAENLLRNEN